MQLVGVLHAANLHMVPRATLLRIREVEVDSKHHSASIRINLILKSLSVPFRSEINLRAKVPNTYDNVERKRTFGWFSVPISVQEQVDPKL